jgi:hypothetical protein
VEGFDDPRLRLSVNEDNLGGEGNFERCMTLGSGAFKAIYHADDVYEPDIVAKEVAFLQRHPDAGAVTVRSRFIDETGKVIRDRPWPRAVRRSRVLGHAEALRLFLRHGNFVVTPSVMARADVYRRMGMWDGKRFGTSADLDLWLRILREHGFGFLDEPLLRYRWSRHSYSYREARRTTREGDLIKVLRAHMVDPATRAAVGPRGVRDLAMQERVDLAIRARNAHLTGDDALSRALVKGTYTGPALRDAFTRRLGFGSFAVGVLTAADLRVPGLFRWLLAAK